MEGGQILMLLLNGLILFALVVLQYWIGDLAEKLDSGKLPILKNVSILLTGDKSKISIEEKEIDVERFTDKLLFCAISTKTNIVIANRITRNVMVYPTKKDIPRFYLAWLKGFFQGDF
jgi:hypothetical protein